VNCLTYSIEDIRRGKQNLAALVEEFRGVRDVLGIPRLRPQLTEGGSQPFGFLSQITERMQMKRQEMYEQPAETEKVTSTLPQQIRPAEILKKQIPLLSQGQQRATPLLDLVKTKSIRTAIRDRITAYTSQVQPQQEESELGEQEWERKKKERLKLEQYSSFEM